MDGGNFYHNPERFCNVLKSRSQIVLSWGSVCAQLGDSWCSVGGQLVFSWGSVGVQLVVSRCSVGGQLVFSWGSVGVQLDSIRIQLKVHLLGIIEYSN